MKGPLAMRRVALMFGGLCAILAIWYLAVRPKTLTVAVGPEKSSQLAYVNAIARLLKETKQPYRFKIVETEGTEDSSKQLESRKVDLAILRSDDLSAKDARSIVIVHRRSLFLAARKGAGIDTLKDLGGKRVAVASSDGDSYLPVLKRILSHYDIDADELEIEELPRTEVPDAFAAGRFDALLMITNPAAKASRKMLSDIAGKKIEFKVTGAPAHEALALRFQELHTREVPEGVFGNDQPEDDVDTVAISYELVATSRMSEQTATALTKSLMELRTRLRSSQANTYAVEAPPVDEERRFLPHAGSAAYVNSEGKTLLEVYSDHIWLALFSLGLIGSSVAGLMSWAGLKQEAPAETLAGEMRALAGRLESASNTSDIDAIQGDFDDLVLSIMREYGLRNLVEEGMPDPSPWLATFAGLISRRRALLADLSPTNTAALQRPMAAQ